MAVEDHPRYAEWREALDRYIQAEERLGHALLSYDRKSVASAILDRNSARSLYRQICDDLDAEA